jgi:glycosyltransferase involved in cell wall biosynthesis
MKISYAIPVCNESVELKRLLSFLSEHKRLEDEIIVQCDRGNTTNEVYKVIEEYSHISFFTSIEYPLNGDFASFKNNLKNHCNGEWVFQIDADEIPSEFLIKNLFDILISNPTIELFLVPRVNIVDGLTQEHIQKWRWNVNENGWVNWPDYQTRIFQNSPKIAWGGKVHEVIVGHSQYSLLPQEENWCLYHPKHIKRQEFQNNYYNTL